MKKWILERLKEPSTWRGVLAILTGAGIGISPDQAVAITAAGLSIMGAVGVFTTDKK